MKDLAGKRKWGRDSGISGNQYFIHLLGNLEDWQMFCNHHNEEKGKVHIDRDEQPPQIR